MTFSRQPVAHLDRRRALAQQIVDRHSETKCANVWRKYCDSIGRKTAKHYIKMRKSNPEIMAELLEPGELTKMIDEQPAVG